MSTKQPELKVDLRTSLSRFGGLLKVLALLGTGIGGTVGYNSFVSPDTNQMENVCAIAFEKRMNEYNQRLVKVETRMDNTDLNIIEIKQSLIRIETYLRDEK